MRGFSTISTSEVPASERVAMWQALTGRIFHSPPSNLQSDGAFEAQMVHGEIGFVGICKVSSSPFRVENRNDAPNQSPRTLKMVLQVRGGTLFEQKSKSVRIAPGEWALYDSGLPYRVSNLAPGERYVLTLPRSAFLIPRLNVDDVLLRAYSGSAGLGRLVQNMITTTFEEISEHRVNCSDAIADSIVGLLQQVFLESSSLKFQSQREFLRERIKTYIQRNLRDPELSIDGMATSLRCTKRNLHKCFQDEGETIGEYISGLRLEACRQALCDPSSTGQSITDIAFGFGFNSAPHFSRVFKKEFGDSPRSLRETISRAH